MRPLPDHRKSVDQMRALYSPAQRTLPALLREIEAAGAALAATTQSWSTFLPRPAALDEAQAAAHGLQRLIGELRAHVTS